MTARERVGARILVAVVVGWVGLSVMPAQARADEEHIVIDGSTTVGPIVKQFAEYFHEMTGVRVEVSESGSGNGAKSLINGTCQIASMSRFMKAKEFKAAIEKDVFPVAHVVAVDGIAMVVHPSNPVQELTVEQVRKIYQGQITNWSELGGPDQPIVKVSRDTNSGTFETFNKLVMHKERMDPGTEKVGSNGAVRQTVQSTPYAIGYVGLGFVDRTIRALKINGIDPTRRNVASGRYPIARPLYLFTNGYPKLGSALHAFVTLHLTKAGQKRIQAIGFIPVTEYDTDE